MKIHLAFLNILNAILWILWTAFCVVLYLTFEIISLIYRYLWLLLPLSFRWVIVISLVTVMLGRAMQGEGTQMPVVYAATAGSECGLPVKVDESIQGDWAGVYRWCELITAEAVEHGFDPALIAAIVFTESRGIPDAFSEDGAVGLMQVMPKDGIAATFQCENGPCFWDRPSINELLDPGFNLDSGSGILLDILFDYQDMREALKHYGPANYGYRYVDQVLETCRKISLQAC